MCRQPGQCGYGGKDLGIIQKGHWRGSKGNSSLRPLCSGGTSALFQSQGGGDLQKHKGLRILEILSPSPRLNSKQPQEALKIEGHSSLLIEKHLPSWPMHSLTSTCLPTCPGSSLRAFSYSESLVAQLHSSDNCGNGFVYFLRKGLITPAIQSILAMNSLCNLGWSHTHNSPASTFQIHTNSSLLL